MSRGTTFWLLKKSNAAVWENFTNERISDYEKSHNDCEVFSNRIPGMDNPKHPKFIASGMNLFDLVDTETSIPYNIALEYAFNSIFGEVREMLMDQYGLNSYAPWNSQMVVSREMARDMLVAANYILLEHFDEKIEKVMDNPFIDSIGSMSEKYLEYQYKLKFPNDSEPFHDEDNVCMIESLRTILSAFLDTDKTEGYVLVLEVWG